MNSSRSDTIQFQAKKLFFSILSTSQLFHNGSVENYFLVDIYRT